MDIDHLRVLHDWMDKFAQVGLSFSEITDRPGWVQATFRGQEYPPLKLRIHLADATGYIESGCDYEFNWNGHTEFGTMWDDSEAERECGRMSLFEWVEHYLSRMERAILNGEGIFVSGTYRRKARAES